MSRLMAVGLTWAVVLAAPAAAQTVLFVDANADQEPHDGSDWCHAYLELSEALATAAPDTIIRIADGTHKPDPTGLDDPREATFQLINGVTIEGGYAGCGATDPDERDIALYETTLSGDLAGDDGQYFQNIDDNCYHVVSANGIQQLALDGLTIVSGNASYHVARTTGGGLFLADGTGIVRGCTFRANTCFDSAGSGGGIALVRADAEVVRCRFEVNFAPRSGGAVAVLDASHLKLTRCVLIGNMSNSYGGGLCYASESTAQVDGCVFIGQSGWYGGAIAAQHNYADVSVTNCTFSENAGHYGGCAIWDTSGATRATNCIARVSWAGQDDQFTGVDVTYSCVRGGQEGEGNIDADPLFVHTPDPGPDEWWGTDDDDYGDLHLLDESPCINAGNDDAVPPDVPFDMDGEDRIQQCRVDMGADETSVILPDCNANGISDACDIEQGSSDDCDSSGVPDECEGPVLYVDDDAPPGGDGTSWHSALDNIQDALAVTDCAVHEIHLAQGTYTPTTEDDRTASFALLNDLAIRGGYRGLTDDGDPDDRDVTQFQTVLSGDIGVLGDPADNSYHVVVATAGESGVLDGVTITAGNADGSSPHNGGGGLLVTGANPTLLYCTFDANAASLGGAVSNESGSPTFSHCTFVGNSSVDFGGAMANHSSSAVLSECVLVGNASNRGGAIYNNSSSPTLDRCVLRENTADNSGGGMCSYYDSSATLVDCTLIGNAARADGAGLFVRGGSAALVNCVFAANSAERFGGGLAGFTTAATVANCSFADNWTGSAGGAMFNGESEVTVVNSTLTRNASQGFAGGIRDANGALTLVNSIVWNNTAPEFPELDAGASFTTVAYSCIRGGWTGDGNIDADPLFIDPDTADFPLSSGSPCIDAADNSAVPADAFDLDSDGNVSEPIPFDLGGKPRFIDDPGTEDSGIGVPPIADIGAYEYQVPGDLDGDGCVGHADLGILLGAWQTDDGGDLDGDGDTDHSDLGILLTNWGVGCQVIKRRDEGHSRASRAASAHPFNHSTI